MVIDGGDGGLKGCLDHCRLKEYGFDEKEVLKGLKKLHVNLVESATSLKNIKIPLILIRPFLSTAHAKIDVFKRKFALRVGNDKIVFKNDSPTNNIIKKVYVVGLRQRMKINLEAILMGEALILNRSQDHEFRDFLELNDLNEPLELRNHKNKDLVVENMDAYRDKYMGDIIFRKPFCRVAVVKARLFGGFITIGDGNDYVTYQMVHSHPRFKHLSNEQCNKIRPLLKVSARDKLEGNSHPYQKLKGFYKGAFSLGPEYIRDEKMFEWLTCGHVSVYEMD
nr:homeodomain-like protein [Tanacetum cinerariifolium]